MNQVAGMSGGRWIQFKLWDDQISVLTLIINNQKIVVLKARQNGLTWLCLSYALHQLLFHPIAMILVYSLRDEEAIAMLSDTKLEGMFKRLPEWMRPDVIQKSKHRWLFANGSEIRALPTTAGDSYTATMAIIDEADLVPNLNETLQRVKPTIDAGGKLILISRSNKKKPKSLFKQIYRAAKKRANDFVDAFLPWFSRPNRTPEWYEKQKAASMAETASLDNLYESYPASDVEALAPSTLDKRLPMKWLEPVWLELNQIDILTNLDVPTIPGLRVYELPEAGERYVAGADPAEGNPTSDDSACSILHKTTGKQVATFNGKHEVTVFAEYIAKLCKFYNNAPVLPERNNHGHALILALTMLRIKLLVGPDKKEGYLNNVRSKTELYDAMAESLRTQDVLITDFESFNQLALIESNTLSAPEGESDDLADAFALANIGRRYHTSASEQTAVAMGRVKGWGTDAKRRT